MDITEETTAQEAWKELKERYGWEQLSTAIFQIQKMGTVDQKVPRQLVKDLESFGMDRLDDLAELA